VAGARRRPLSRHHPLDANTDNESYAPPSDWLTVGVLAYALKAATSSATVTADVGNASSTLQLAFGAHRRKCHPLRHVRRADPVATANCIAQYVTKDGDVTGSARLPDPLRGRAVVPALRTAVPAAHRDRQGVRGTADAPAREGGHPLTKSCCFPVAFGQLCAARKARRCARRHPDDELDSEADQRRNCGATPWGLALHRYRMPGIRRPCLGPYARRRERTLAHAPSHHPSITTPPQL
jgi:hypothetical protein